MGIYAPDGSYRVSVVDGSTVGGIYMPDGSYRVTVVNGEAPQVSLLAASPAAIAHTGTTDETVVATVVIPGGLMGTNGRLRVTSLWTWPNSANSKTVRVRFSGLSGTQVNAGVGTT